MTTRSTKGNVPIFWIGKLRSWFTPTVVGGSSVVIGLFEHVNGAFRTASVRSAPIQARGRRAPVFAFKQNTVCAGRPQAANQRFAYAVRTEVNASSSNAR
ncbi:hypothetical protein [Rhizobium puerariae]|uniref:hypothetical protein n=1 Tax=Rhizobium puerariae TaxID=1585791 RepID=UPI0036710D92